MRSLFWPALLLLAACGGPEPNLRSQDPYERYLGEKDINFILLTEIEELTERLRFERDRLEKDEAVYAMTDCDAEMRLYGTEIHKVVNILRKTLADLDALKMSYR